MTKPNLVVQAMTERVRRKHWPDMEGRRRNANRTAGHREEGRKQPPYRLGLRGIQRFSHVRQQGGRCEGFLEKQTVLLGDAIAYDGF
jgi:hypothetical protein